MKRPSFFHGIALAAILAITASVVVGGLMPFVGAGAVLRLVVPAICLAYLWYLLRSSSHRTGRVTTLACWTILAAFAWWLAPPLPIYVLIHVGAIWIVRSLYFYSGFLPVLADLGISCLAAMASAWAITRSGSVLLATWSFFLVQALFVAIPAALPRRAEMRGSSADDTRFQHARRRADAALKQLIAQ